MTASSNFGNVLSVLAASAFLPFLPMSALHLLLLGMAYTVSCTALPWDDVDDSFVSRPRAWNARGIVSFMLAIGPVSTIFDIITFAVLFWIVCPAVTGATWDALIDPTSRSVFITVFQTGWFVESMWTQTLVIHLLRTERIPVIQSRAGLGLTVFTVAGVMLVTAMPYIPAIEAAVGLLPLPSMFFISLGLTMGGYLALTSLVKTRYVRSHDGLL